MKVKVLSVVVGVLVVCAASIVADEYGYFSRIEFEYFSKVVTLKEGDRMTFLAVNDPSDRWNAILDLPDGNQITLDSISDLFVANDSGAETRTICGPCSVSIDKSASVGCRYIAYKIVRASDNSIKPSNVIVLPADVDGDMQLVFESSDDLLAWDQVYSFTHNSTNQTSKFFRTRLIQGTGE